MWFASHKPFTEKGLFLMRRCFPCPAPRSRAISVRLTAGLPGSVASALGLTVLLAACGGAGQPAATPSSAASPPISSRANSPVSWTMPNLVGSNLQDAQNAIQKLTGSAIFVTRSHDATGAGRHQVLDRNWKVCSQNVPVGHTIRADTRIDFGAVKLDERCP